MNVGKAEGVGGKVETLSVTVLKDERGYGMTVSGNDPVIVQSVLKNGAAWKAGVRYGDRLLQVNGMPVETSLHDDVVSLIKSSTSTTLLLQRQISTSKVTAPLPVDRERQRQVEFTKVHTLQKMLEEENRHRTALLKSNRNTQELDTTESRIEKLQQQIDKICQNSFVISSKEPYNLPSVEPPVTPLRAKLPRSLSGLTGHSLRGNRYSQGIEQHPVTCLDGPPPLPPRTPNTLSPEALSSRGHSPIGFSQGQPQVSMPSRYGEPNSIDLQMNYPLSVSHPPIQSGGLGHQTSRCSSEHLSHLNNSSDGKDWEMVTTPPGTPPPPYPSTPAPRIPQKVIMSMEEDDNTNSIISGVYSSGGFKNVENLSIARKAVFLNWLIGERRPPQAALLYLLTTAYSIGPATSLLRWAYEIHSTFLIPGAPLSLNSIDENMAREIDDVLINESDKEDVLRKVFLKVREKAKEELNVQIAEFQAKRQSGLGTFYGPTDVVLEQCDYDKQQEVAVISYWLKPRLDNWLDEASGDPWGATYGSSTSAILAATVQPLLQYNFCLKSQIIGNLLRTPSAGAPPNPTFLQRDKLYKHRIKFISKSMTSPLQIYGHNLSPSTVTSICHCHHCHFPVYGIAPQAYTCSVCRLRVHRSCAKRIEEPCCGPTVPATRISRIMEKLSSGTAISPTLGNSHQHIEPNQQLHHDKKQRKSIATSNFLNMERSFRKNEEENHTGTDSNATSHHFFADIELVINPTDDHPAEEDNAKNDSIEKDEMDAETPPVTLTDSECEADKKKKNKPKHRKTMSMSNTIEMVRSMGDEWFEAAKREIGEHSKKKENAKKKKESDASNEKNDVVLVLSDATIGETDDFEVAIEHFPPAKLNKKKEAKVKEVTPKIATSQIMTAQKMGVKMIAKASSVGALNFIRKKRPAPITGVDNASVEEIVLSTAIFLDSERAHSDMVRKPNIIVSLDKSVTDEEADGEIFYDAKAGSQDESDADDDPELKIKSKTKVKGLRTRKSYGGSLKRTGGGRRKPRRRSNAEEVPPLPPKSFVPPPPPPKQSSYWLFGNSSSAKGGEKNASADDTGADGLPYVHEPWHTTDNQERDTSSSIRQKPVTRAESYRDKGVKVHRTKRKTSDPNQLTSGNNYHDAEASGNVGAPSGGSSSSSLSSRSNESAGQPEHQDSHSEWSEEEENSEPWSSRAPADILSTMSMKARKRQDLIHELIATEATHVRSLRILRRVFATPLQRSTLLTPVELKALFPNLPDVLQKHRRLSTDLKALSSTGTVVKIKPLAEVMIATLGEPKYSVTLAKFCAGQRLALDSLRERRRRTKELHAFLAKREQDPICTRLRLQDFLACVWQRLTKYQLLLEGIIKTGREEDNNDPQNVEEEGISRISHALDLAKEILHTVDTAIKTTENDHRLKTIQSKLEIRGVSTAPGADMDPGELRRLDLVKHSLVMEGTLSLRQDSTKRLSVLALMLSECLVLLQKESDKYILRPIPQATHQPLSPVIHWKTVLFRTNAAAKYGFFLVNKAGLQMYDMKATNSSEYNMWIRNLTEATKFTHGSQVGAVDEGPSIPPPTAPPPASSTHPDEIPQDVSDPNLALDDDEDHSEPHDKDIEEPQLPTVNEDDGKQVSGAVGSIVGESDSDGMFNTVKFADDLVTPSAVAITAPPTALTAHRQLTSEERLRQAEEKISIALREAIEAANEIAQLKPNVYSGVKTLLGKESDEQWKTSLGNGLEYKPAEKEYVSTTQLILTAQEHVNNLTEVLVRALRTTTPDCSVTRCSVQSNYGLCDNCYDKHSKHTPPSKNRDTDNGDVQTDSAVIDETVNKFVYIPNLPQDSVDPSVSEGKANSIVVLEDVGESSTDPCENPNFNLLSASSVGLRDILSTLIQRLPSEEQERELLRARLQQADHRLHRLHHLHRECPLNRDEDGSHLDIVHEVPNSNSNDQSGEG